MPNRAYQRGAKFERECKRQAEEHGFFVIRSAGSHSPIDLVFVRLCGRVTLVQCKKDGKVSNEEWQKLETIGKRYHSDVLIMSKGPDDIEFEYVYNAGHHEDTAAACEDESEESSKEGTTAPGRLWA